MGSTQLGRVGELNTEGQGGQEGRGKRWGG